MESSDRSLVAAITDPLGIGAATLTWLLWWWPDGESAATPAPERLTLRDGGSAWIRPLTQNDRELHRTNYERLSEQSKYRRFLFTVPHLTEDLLKLLVDDVDGVDHIAYVLFVDGDESPLPAAIGRIVRIPGSPDAADLAVTVMDAHQGRGIATALLQILIARRPAGVTRIETIVAAENTASVAMLKRLGPSTLVPLDGGSTLEVHISLDEESAQCDVPEDKSVPRSWHTRLQERDLVCSWLRPEGGELPQQATLQADGETSAENLASDEDSGPARDTPCP